MIGVPGRLRPRIFLTLCTTRLVGRQPHAPAAFTPGEIPGTHFQGLSRPQGTWFCQKEPQKKSLVTPPGIDPGTVRLVAQCRIKVGIWNKCILTLSILRIIIIITIINSCYLLGDTGHQLILCTLAELSTYKTNICTTDIDPHNNTVLCWLSVSAELHQLLEVYTPIFKMHQNITIKKHIIS